MMFIPTLDEILDEYDDAIRDAFKNDEGAPYYMGDSNSSEAEFYVESLLSSARLHFAEMRAALSRLSNEAV